MVADAGEALWLAFEQQCVAWRETLDPESYGEPERESAVAAAQLRCGRAAIRYVRWARKWLSRHPRAGDRDKVLCSMGEAFQATDASTLDTEIFPTINWWCGYVMTNWNALDFETRYVWLPRVAGYGYYAAWESQYEYQMRGYSDRLALFAQGLGHSPRDRYVWARCTWPQLFEDVRSRRPDCRRPLPKHDALLTVAESLNNDVDPLDCVTFASDMNRIFTYDRGITSRTLWLLVKREAAYCCAQSRNVSVRNVSALAEYVGDMLDWQWPHERITDHGPLGAFADIEWLLPQAQKVLDYVATQWNPDEPLWQELVFLLAWWHVGYLSVEGRDATLAVIADFRAKAVARASKGRRVDDGAEDIAAVILWILASWELLYDHHPELAVERSGGHRSEWVASFNALDGLTVPASVNMLATDELSWSATELNRMRAEVVDPLS